MPGLWRRPPGFTSADIPDLPGVNTFSIGFGAAYDIRPTVALVAEVIPTLLNSGELGIHRPAYSIGIQKKLFRHAFTLGLTTSPGVTVSQRAGTRAEFLGRTIGGHARRPIFRIRSDAPDSLGGIGGKRNWRPLRQQQPDEHAGDRAQQRR